MISTIHGQLHAQLVPHASLQVTPAGRAEVCAMRGEVMGLPVNVTVTLDTETGEVLLLSPDGFCGVLRLGDMLVEHVAMKLAHAARERMEAAHAQTH